LEGIEGYPWILIDERSGDLDETSYDSYEKMPYRYVDVEVEVEVELVLDLLNSIMRKY